MPRSGSSNGGVIGKVNNTSFGKCTVTTQTASTPSAVTTQPGTRVVSTLVVGGGGGGGGGGPGSPGIGGTPDSGTNGLGGGAGGACDSGPGSTGGSGVVIISYSESETAFTATSGSPTITTSGGNRIYTFTSSGSFTP